MVNSGDEFDINGFPCASRRQYINKLLVTVPDYIKKVLCDTTPQTKPFSCAVRSCNNRFSTFRAEAPIKYHKFPSISDINLHNTWIKACGVSEFVDVTQCMVCSDHFTPDDYVRNYKQEFSNPKFKRQLKHDAIPNKLLPTGDQTDQDIESEASQISDAIKAAVDEQEVLEMMQKKLAQNKMESQVRLQRLNKLIRTKLLEHKRVEQQLRELKPKKILRKVLSPAQIKILKGKKKVYWSEDDLAMAFSLRHMGGKECYLYLKHTLNWPLPALSCVQKWATSIDE